MEWGGFMHGSVTHGYEGRVFYGPRVAV